jgi:hypothetical protein
MRILDTDLLELVLLDLDVLALADLIAAPDAFLLQRLTGFGVNHLLLQPIASFLIARVCAHRDTYNRHVSAHF